MSPFTSEGTENKMRWDRRSSGFMEVWYATLNHLESGTGLWFRYTVTAPSRGLGSPYCELWAFYFDPEGKRTFGAKQRLGIDSLRSDHGAIVAIGDAWLGEDHLEGAIVRDGRSLSWRLDFEPADRCFQHLPANIRRRAERRVSTVCSPNLSVPFSGEVDLDGDVLRLNRAPGCQSHRWGRRHSLSWAWSHCSIFEHDDPALFEGVAARTTLGPVPVPTTSFLYLTYQGDELAFNELRWALKARSHYEMPTWPFTARNDRWKIVGAARVPLERMIQVEYRDPDGSARYCANSEIADLAIEIYGRVGERWRHHASITALRTAHLEFGRREPFDELSVVV